MAPPSSPDPGSSGLSTGVKVLIGVLIAMLLVIGGGIAAAIAIPAFLNQRARSYEAELASAVRNAVLEVEAEATMRSGDYSAIDDFIGLVETELAFYSDSVVLRPDSALTYARQDAFAICAEHEQLPGSVAYISDEGGLQAYSEAPCP